MIRLFAPLVNLIVAVFLNILLQGDVSVKIDVPNEVVAGNEFEVKVTINKGDLESFSRLLQSLPAGLTATSVETANSDFNFENKRARFIWLRLPEGEQVTVAYKIKVDPRLKGTFSIDGRFSYIADNARRSVDIKSNIINILPSPDVDPSLIVDIADYEKMVVPYVAPATASPQVACIRETPQPVENGRAYIVNLLVSKETKEKFAKIEEKVPAGYKAESVTDGDAIFTFKKNTAKYLWMNLPSSKFFIVSYKLTPIAGTKNPPKLSGKFSYLEDDKTISIDIRQTGQDLAQVKTREDLANLIAGLPEEQQLASVETNAPGNTDIVEKHITTKHEGNIKNRINRINGRYRLEPEEGIYYRVQIAAGHNPVNIKRYFKKYKLDKEVRAEKHEGWNKYSIGSFGEYKEARDYRVHIWNTTVIDDAFVSAYNNGDRITVQEALMIANQKWYK